MKKILALLVCLLTISTGVRADDDRPVRFDQLPAKAQAYVKKYFPQEKVALAKMEKDFFDKKYEVIFANSSKVEFFKDGTWKEVFHCSRSCHSRSHPTLCKGYLSRS